MKYEFIYQEKKDGNLFELYRSLEWQQYLKIDADSLKTAMKNSFRIIYVYDGDKLIGTGRVISDGIINAYICGIGVESEYRNRGIGSEILKKLVNDCVKMNLHVQLICEEELITWYETKGFELFAVAMKIKMV